MANTIITKNSSTTTSVPSSLTAGELAVNTTDLKLFVGDGAAVQTVAVSPTVAHTFTAGIRGEITTLTDGATITPNMDDSNNFTVTLEGNRTLANPTNLTAGQSGSIFIVQDGTGSRTLAWGSYWDFAGGTAPTLTTTASAVDRVDYVVRSATSIHAVFTADYS
jgi:hypothetical protein